LLALVLPGVAVVATAAERPVPNVPVWGDAFVKNLPGLDLSTMTGIEGLGANWWKEVRVDPADATRRITRNWMRLRVNSAVDNSQISDMSFFAASGSYPDPATAVNTTYYCSDEGFFYPTNPLNEFPCEDSFGLGIATAGATRYLVAGAAFGAAYFVAGGSFTRIGAGSVEVFDPETGASLWRRSWPSFDGTWSLRIRRSGVADYLGDDGVDELRIVQFRGLPDGTLVWRNSFYSIADGSLIKEDRVRVPRT